MIADPVSATAVSTNTHQPAIPLHDECLSDWRILLAEDSPDNQRLISRVLERAGADVQIADNGLVAVEQALAAVERGCPFDVILMDIQMPVLDGYDATKQLRAKSYKGAIIALTAHAMPEDEARSRAAGCDDFATKPINRTKLIAAILSHSQNNRQKTADQSASLSTATKG
jgi:CheY-like chemotaxis protein